jgi:N-acetylglucosaminyl-diphospho-decaprenol L-rhamnosyltransferase
MASRRMPGVSDAFPVSRPEGAEVATRLSIVIVSWNTRALLEKCLSSIEREMSGAAAVSSSQGGPEVEVVVVDNASTDGSAQMVRDRFPRVRLIVNAENAGFARANNQAIREGNGEHVLLLNPDTEVKDDALEVLVRFMDEHPGVGAAGARLLNPDGTLQHSCHPMPTLLRELWRMLHLDVLRPLARYPMDGWPVDVPRPVDVTQGACLIVRRSALDRVGLLDEDYFIYSEEVDLCYRLKQDGWLIYWVPEAAVIHHGGQSTGQIAEPMFQNLYRYKVHFVRKHYGPSSARLYKLILMLASMVRFALYPLALLGSPARRGQKLLLANRYRRLITALPQF